MTGIFITARLGSTRLTQKHLIKANGKTFIEWLVERYITEFYDEIKNNKVGIFITSSVAPENRKFEEIFKNENVQVFYGSDQNIPLRHLQCAEKNLVDNIISIDGDDILCSAKAARLIYNGIGAFEIMQTKGLPLGMNVFGYTTKFLKDSLAKITTEKLETGWGKIFDDKKMHTVLIEANNEEEKLRMTLDYAEDADFFIKVITDIGDQILSISDKDLIQFILKNKLYELNTHLNDQYWINFNKQKELEN